MFVSNATTSTDYLTSPMFVKYGIDLSDFEGVEFLVNSDNTILTLSNVPNPNKNYLVGGETGGKALNVWDFSTLFTTNSFIYIDRLGEWRKIINVTYSDSIINLSDLPYLGTSIQIESPFSEPLVDEVLYIIKGTEGCVYPIAPVILYERNFSNELVEGATFNTIFKSREIQLFKSSGCLVKEYSFSVVIDV